MSETAPRSIENDKFALPQLEVVVPRDDEISPREVVQLHVGQTAVHEAENFDIDFETDKAVEKVIVTEDNVKDYLRAIGKTPLLTKEDEVELGKAIEAGLFAGDRREKMIMEGVPESSAEIRELKELERLGARAVENMTRANLRLVVSLAKRYTDHGLDFIDLIQEGNLGLMKAVEQFDYKKEFKFSTYATWWIRQSLGRNLADKGREIRVPVHVVEKINSITRTKRLLLLDQGHEPSDEEVADALNITVKKLKEMETYARKPFSLNTKLIVGEDAEFGDRFVDTNDQELIASSEQEDLKKQLGAFVDALRPQQAEVLRRLFGLDGKEPESMAEIAESFQISRQTISQRRDRGLEKLRTAMKDDPKALALREYLA